MVALILFLTAIYLAMVVWGAVIFVSTILGECRNDFAPKKVEEGLLRNKAFQEYRALSRESRDTLKKQAYEQKDLSQVENKDEQIFALQDIVTTQVGLVADLNRQLDGARAVFKAISGEILDISDQHFIDPQHQATTLAEK
jgi:hypothetical protein